LPPKGFSGKENLNAIEKYAAKLFTVLALKKRETSKDYLVTVWHFRRITDNYGQFADTRRVGGVRRTA